VSRRHIWNYAISENEVSVGVGIHGSPDESSSLVAPIPLSTSVASCGRSSGHISRATSPMFKHSPCRRNYLKPSGAHASVSKCHRINRNLVAVPGLPPRLPASPRSFSPLARWLGFTLGLSFPSRGPVLSVASHSCIMDMTRCKRETWNGGSKR
jgi:hypothetical protein